MKHYNNKSNNMFKILKKDGFTCETLKKNRNKFYVFKGNGNKILIHSGENSYHPLKRFLKNEYGYTFVL